MPGILKDGESRRGLRVLRGWLQAWWHRRVPFAISLGPIFWLLISEIYPLKIRNSAEGIAATFNWGANLLITLTFLTLLERVGPSGTFWLYGASAIAAGIFSYYYVPETKGRSLEEIEEFWHKKNQFAEATHKQ